MKARVVVIGLDCATFDLIRPFVAGGYLPNIKRVMDEGVSRNLESTVPPLSPPAWATFLTGKNPARHGIFHFFDLDAGKYNFTENRLVNSSFFAGHTFIDFISDQGGKVGIIKIPFTYPPWKVNGFMIAGDPSPDWRKAHTYPPELSEKCGRINLGDHLDFERYDVEELLEHLKYDCHARTRLACTMLNEAPYDFFMLVHNTTDAAVHRFWKYTDNACPNYDERFRKYEDIIRDVYTDADDSIRKVLDLIGRDTTIFFMSDHGAVRKALYYFQINAWLKDEGYLYFHENKKYARFLHEYVNRMKYMVPSHLRHVIGTMARAMFLKNISKFQSWSASYDWARTKAYAVTIHPSYDGIVINLKGRQPQGTVDPGPEAEDLCARISERLADLEDPRTGRKIVKQIYRREEIFRGKFAERMPELIVQYARDYRGGKGTSVPLFGDVPAADFDFQSGDHDENGIFMAIGPNVRKAAELAPARIQDVAPTILYAMGLPIPDDMDGQVLLDIFEQGFVEANPLRKTGSADGTDRRAYELNEEESAEMKKQLQGLGYL